MVCGEKAPLRVGMKCFFAVPVGTSNWRFTVIPTVEAIFCLNIKRAIQNLYIGLYMFTRSLMFLGYVYKVEQALVVSHIFTVELSTGWYQQFLSSRFRPAFIPSKMYIHFFCEEALVSNINKIKLFPVNLISSHCLEVISHFTQGASSSNVSQLTSLNIAYIIITNLCLFYI